MKLQIEQSASRNTITAYGNGYVSVNAVRHTANLIVLPDRLVEGWTPATFDTLTVADFELLVGLDADVVIVGTGDRLRFPPAALRRPFLEARKGLEFMDIGAACRTYNILIGEGRRAAAGLIFS